MDTAPTDGHALVDSRGTSRGRWPRRMGAASTSDHGPSGGERSAVIPRAAPAPKGNRRTRLLRKLGKSAERVDIGARGQAPGAAEKRPMCREKPGGSASAHGPVTGGCPRKTPGPSRGTGSGGGGTGKPTVRKGGREGPSERRGKERRGTWLAGCGKPLRREEAGREAPVRPGAEGRVRSGGCGRCARSPLTGRCLRRRGKAPVRLYGRPARAAAVQHAGWPPDGPPSRGRQLRLLASGGPVRRRPPQHQEPAGSRPLGYRATRNAVHSPSTSAGRRGPPVRPGQPLPIRRHRSR